MYQEAELRGFLTSEETLTGILTDTQGLSGVLSAGVGAAGDYNNLINKPRINNIVIEGNKTPLQYGFPTVAVTGSYTDLVNKPTIPTKTSELTNDSGFITEAAIPTKTSELTNDSGFITDSGLATVATTGDYDDLLNKPTIPAAQVNSDWNAISGVAKILNKPTIPAAQVNSDWNATSGVAEILNKPTIPAAQVNSDWNASSGVAQILNKPTIPTKTSELTNDSGFITNSGLATVATTGDYDDLLNKPTIPAAQVNSDWNASSGVAEILNKPTLATVATTGDYDDLTNKPTIPAAQVNSDWNASSGVAQILNKPTIPTKTSDLTNDAGFSKVSSFTNDITTTNDGLAAVTLPSGVPINNCMCVVVQNPAGAYLYAFLIKQPSVLWVDVRQFNGTAYAAQDCTVKIFYYL